MFHNEKLPVIINKYEHNYWSISIVYTINIVSINIYWYKLNKSNKRFSLTVRVPGKQTDYYITVRKTGEAWNGPACQWLRRWRRALQWEGWRTAAPTATTTARASHSSHHDHTQCSARLHHTPSTFTHHTFIAAQHAHELPPGLECGRVCSQVLKISCHLMFTSSNRCVR